MITSLIIYLLTLIYNRLEKILEWSPINIKIIYEPPSKIKSATDLNLKMKKSNNELEPYGPPYHAFTVVIWLSASLFLFFLIFYVGRINSI